MKKYLCSLVFMAMSLFVLSGCGSEQLPEAEGWKPTIYETTNNFKGVTMIIKEGTVSSKGLTVILENNSDKQGLFGEDFSLEKKINGKWYQVPISTDGNYGFNSIGYDLASSDAREWKAHWDSLYGSLEAGEYRIVKEILDFRTSGDFDKYYLTAEFVVD